MAIAFNLARLPRVEFGAGSLSKLPTILGQYGKSILLVTGSRSFLASPAWSSLETRLQDGGFGWEIVQVVSEPSPALVDETVRACSGQTSEPP